MICGATMQQPQYSSHGYPPPTYGDHLYHSDTGAQPYAAPYGPPHAEAYSYAPAPHAEAPQSSEHGSGYYTQAPPYHTGNVAEPPPPGPHGYETASSHFGGGAPPSQQGSALDRAHGSYSTPPYTYTQPYETAPSLGAESHQAPAVGSQPETYADAYGGGPPAYSGQQERYPSGSGGALPSYAASEPGYGGDTTYPGYYGSSQPITTYGQQPSADYARQSSSDLGYGASGSTSKPASYVNTPPQSSYESIQAGLSSLSVGNPPSKQPNYLDRADSGGSNLVSFKSSYGGTIRYEAPRSSNSVPQKDTGSYGRGGSSELIDIVQGPGSSGGGGYRSGRAQAPDTVEVQGGLQRFKVRLMLDGSGSGASEQVQCQVDLEGVRLFNADGKIVLRFYPLKSITRWAVQQPTVFTFWTKTAVDVEQRAVKLASNEYTTRAILDTVTAACVQVGEMMDNSGGGSQAPTTASVSAASSDAAKPKGMSIVEWVTQKPLVEEKLHWIPDENANKCSSCGGTFTAFNRRHHCRNCGEVFCDSCTKGRIALTSEEGAPQVRVCDRCFGEVTQRLQNVQPAKPASSAYSSTHEDLARKLQAELDRKKPVQSQSSGGEGPTVVLTCKSCGTVSLGSGTDPRCSACGADANKAPSSSSSSKGASRQSSYSTDGPPHLWDQQPAKAPARTRQVACPTCTVHLTVNVPSTGTETVECGVCQHPFLVTA